VQQDLVTPIVVNLKLDPFERFIDSRGYGEWVEDRAWTYAPAFAKVGEFLQSLKNYPPRMKSADFNIDEAMRALTPSSGQ
jgi:arylsulfatase